MAITVERANLVVKDKNGNIGTVETFSANDITKLNNAINDVAVVVNPTTHQPVSAIEVDSTYTEPAVKNGIMSAATNLLTSPSSSTELEPRSMLIEAFSNGTYGYRLYSDGYCEQWGKAVVSATGPCTLTLAKTYDSADFNVQATPSVNTCYAACTATTANTVTIECRGNDGSEHSCAAYWRTFGYVS